MIYLGGEIAKYLDDPVRFIRNFGIHYIRYAPRRSRGWRRHVRRMKAARR